MEQGEVIRLVAAFVGGGIGKTVLDHFLNDWTARRSAVRPKDMGRIETLRQQANALLEMQSDAVAGYRVKPQSMPTGDFISPEIHEVTRRALIELGTGGCTVSGSSSSTTLYSTQGGMSALTMSQQRRGQNLSTCTSEYSNS